MQWVFFVVDVSHTGGLLDYLHLYRRLRPPISLSAQDRATGSFNWWNARVVTSHPSASDTLSVVGWIALLAELRWMTEGGRGGNFEPSRCSSLH